MVPFWAKLLQNICLEHFIFTATQGFEVLRGSLMHLVVCSYLAMGAGRCMERRVVGAVERNEGIRGRNLLDFKGGWEGRSFPRFWSGVAPANQAKERPVHELFSRKHSGTKVRDVSFVLVFLRKTQEFTKMGEVHELFVLALSLAWFAGATPDLRGKIR